MLGKILAQGCYSPPSSTSAMASPWEIDKNLPTVGESKSIGSYANGCLAGGRDASAPQGEGYQVDPC